MVKKKVEVSRGMRTKLTAKRDKACSAVTQLLVSIVKEIRSHIRILRRRMH